MNVNCFFSEINKNSKKPLPKKPPGPLFHEIKTKTLKLPQKFGQVELNHRVPVAKDLLELLSGVTLNTDLSWEDFLFFDIETTGLSAGTGNFPFLTGFLFIEDDKIKIEQYISYEFSGFGRMINKMKNRLKRHACLVSYNGKSFDRHILNSHMLLNREPFSGLLEKKHLDLLHISRLLWKKELNQFNLKNVEKEILKFHRVDDISGQEAAEHYLLYQRNKDLSLLSPILSHNEWDIISLFALLITINDNWMKGSFQPSTLLEILKKGIKTKKREMALQLIELLEKDNRMTSSERSFFYFTSAGFYKREKMKNEEETFLLRLNSLESQLALAKLYEHGKKEYLKAFEYATRIKKRLLIHNQLNIIKSNTTTTLPSIEKRIERLRKKINRQNHKES